MAFEASNLSNVDIDSGTINGPIAAGGTWTAAATWTLPTFTLGGTVTLNGQSFSGTCANGGTFTTIDINGGTIDGTAVNATTLSASGVTNLDAGTVAAPGVILESETGTGLYRIGANNHGYAVSGSKVLDISSTGLGVTGSVTASTGLYERGRTPAVGEWTTPAFEAGNFSANGSMTWTVEAGDVVTYQYTVIGKTMTLNFFIASTVIGGTINNTLKIAIPGGYAAAKRSIGSGIFYDDGAWSTTSLVLDTAAAGETVINLFKGFAAPNWTAGDAAVVGSITFEIQ
jgi:hypothetical protein